MPNMFLSKAIEMQECWRKYFFTYQMQIAPKEESKYFRIGRIFHSVSEAILKDEDVMKPLDTSEVEEREMILDLLNAKCKATKRDFTQVLKEMKKGLLASESPISVTFSKKWNWVIKVDAISEEESGTWMNEFKTASGHGPATASFYHNSPQTWTYLYNLDNLYPRLKGVRFHIVTKTKEPTLYTEEVFIDSIMMQRAEFLIKDAIYQADLIEETGTYPRSGTHCKTFRDECEYLKLCYIYNPILDAPEVGIRPAYVKEVLELFKKKDPEDHLWKK